jgi:hypothetical protein
MMTEDSPLSKAIRVDVDTIAQGATPLPVDGPGPLDFPTISVTAMLG